MTHSIPVWMGGRIILDAITKKESYLDFEPDCVMGEADEGILPIDKGHPIPLFEICVYAEHEHQLEARFRKAIEDIKGRFLKCHVWQDGQPTKMAPKCDGTNERHTLDWQMFGLFRAAGVYQA